MGWLVKARSGRFPTEQTSYPLYTGQDGLQCRSGRAQKTSPPPGFDPRTFRPVAAGYTDYAIPAHPNFYIHIYTGALYVA
jgi:hypothetical protein